MKESVRQALVIAGWSPDRTRPVEGDMAELAAAGFASTDSLRAFLREFGGLTVRYELSSGWDEAVFEVEIEPDSWLSERAEWYAERVGVPLTPVGWCGDGLSVILRAEDGRLFAGADQWMSYLGPTPFAAIEALMESRFERVP